ncbi:MAG: mannitol dehydrogenase [Frankiales bacterium]|nr:mannitol dehydrogenase [Frankiales bacterium]
MSPTDPQDLRSDTLGWYADQVDVPIYDRSELLPSVVHIGVGGFHRAHQALYFDELARHGETGWGLVGVGLRRPEMGQVLQAQDGLFTVVERDEGGERARVIGSMVDYLFAPDDPEAVLRRLADPQTRLVTLTVTGGGYAVDGDDLDDSDDGVRHDLAHPGVPTTMVGFLVEALRRRRESGAGPFTVLSCDNLPDSGAAARTAVTRFAARLDPGLERWISDHVSFPSSMVDRITPETSPAARDEVQDAFGVPDRWPVVTEPFRQWVIEDRFCNGRPPLERVGVRFVQDVAPYKLVKARLLNGGHSALGYLGSLRGCGTSDEAMADPVVRTAVEHLLRREVLPLLPQVDGLDLQDYLDQTLSRFGNPAVGDQLRRLARRGSVKMPSYVLPSLRDAIAQDRPHRLLLLVVAAWMRYLRGTDLAGNPVTVEDPRAEALQALVRQGGSDPRPLLGMRSVFGRLGDDPRVVEGVTELLRLLDEQGLPAALQACLDESLPEAA